VKLICSGDLPHEMPLAALQSLSRETFFRFTGTDFIGVSRADITPSSFLFVLAP